MKRDNVKRIKVTHIITSLLMGGAEKVLLRLLQDMDEAVFDNQVIALTTVGPLAEEFAQAGISVEVIGYSKGNSNIAPFFRLCRALRRRKPDVVQTWLYHGDLLGGTSARLCTDAPVLWNLRQSNLDHDHSAKSTLMIAKLCSVLSSFVPKTIVCGSHAAQVVHEALGYNKSKMLLIENGFDTDKHHRSEELRQAWRQRLNLGNDMFAIGHAARLDPQKDHETFLHAVALVAKENPQVKFVLCGTNITSDSNQLMELITALGLENHVELLGIVDDMVGFYAAMDAVVMSSAYGEGAPNVLGEAMSCETPCISTDIGDSARIVGDTGLIVPIRNAEAMAEAILTVARETLEQRQLRGKAARQRIIDELPLEKMVKGYEDLYRGFR